jgi:hypothetical protein
MEAHTPGHDTCDSESMQDVQMGQPRDSFIVSVRQQRDWAARFLGLTGGSLLYGLSALSIVYGITQLIGPPLAKSDALRDILPCVGVLNAYELTLFAVLLTIMIWRHVTSDAICLVVLVGVFWTASGMTLGIVAPSGPDICLAIGLAATAIALAKLALLKRFVRLPVGTLSLVGIGLILAWNFLGASLMARPMVARIADDAMRRSHWIYSWLLILSGACLFWGSAVRKRYPTPAERLPFLYTDAMVWIFVLVQLSGAAIHQYGVAYMFAIDHYQGDFLPLASLSVFMSLELMRSLRKQFGCLEIGIACVPLALTALAVFNKSTVPTASLTHEALFFPPVVLGLTGLGLIWMGLQHGWQRLYYVAVAYGLCMLLTMSQTNTLNLPLFGAGLVVTLVLLGVYKRSPEICTCAVLASAVGLGQVHAFGQWAQQHHLTIVQAAALASGLGTLTIALAFGRKMPRPLILIGVTALVFGVFKGIPESVQWPDLAEGLALAVLFVALGLRTRDWPMALFLWIPVIPKAYIFATHMSSWAFVILSFPLLFLGACVSLFVRNKLPEKQKTDTLAPCKKTQTEN